MELQSGLLQEKNIACVQLCTSGVTTQHARQRSNQYEDAVADSALTVSNLMQIWRETIIFTDGRVAGHFLPYNEFECVLTTSAVV